MLSEWPFPAKLGYPIFPFGPQHGGSGLTTRRTTKDFFPDFSKSTSFILEVYTIAGIHDCRYTRLQVYTIAGIHDCRYTRLQVYTIAGIHDCRYTRLQVYTIAGIHDCRYTLLNIVFGLKQYVHQQEYCEYLFPIPQSDVEDPC